MIYCLFQRHAHWVKMANMAQLVNVIAPIFATSSEDKNSVTISVVNCHHSEAIEVLINLGDYQPTQGKVYTINGDDPFGYTLLPDGKSISDNKYNPEACKVTEDLLKRVSSKIIYSFPVHSITLLVLRR